MIESLNVLNQDPGFRTDFRFLWWDDQLGTEALVLLLALAAGIVGSLVHYATSLVKYAGNQQFRLRWTLWYTGRPLIGGLLAVLIYLLVRAGLLPSDVAAADLSSYGVAALSGLAGMFSKQAVEKLEQLFNTAFGSGQPMGDSLEPEGPTAESARLVRTGPGAPYVEIRGTGFGDKGAMVAIGLETREAAVTTDEIVRVRLDPAEATDAEGFEVAVIRGDGQAS